MEVEQGCIFNFYESKDGKTWKSVLILLKRRAFLTRWDRVQRQDYFTAVLKMCQRICLFQNEKLEINELDNK